MDRPIERLSPLATIARHTTALAVGPGILERKIREARANARRRELLVLHDDVDCAVQRMVNAIEPGSYIRPHRHSAPSRAEAIVLLTGSLGFVAFGDDGSPDFAQSALLDRRAGVLAVDCRGNIWHTFLALEPGTTIFEVKAGPYDPDRDKEFATWAPPENSGEAGTYLSNVERAFRAAFRPAT